MNNVCHCVILCEDFRVVRKVGRCICLLKSWISCGGWTENGGETVDEGRYTSVLDVQQHVVLPFYHLLVM